MSFLLSSRIRRWVILANAVPLGRGCSPRWPSGSASAAELTARSRGAQRPAELAPAPHPRRRSSGARPVSRCASTSEPRCRRERQGRARSRESSVGVPGVAPRSVHALAVSRRSRRTPIGTVKLCVAPVPMNWLTRQGRRLAWVANARARGRAPGYTSARRRTGADAELRRLPRRPPSYRRRSKRDDLAVDGDVGGVEDHLLHRGVLGPQHDLVATA